MAVSDFRTGVVDLVPWIAPGHPLHGLGVEDVYRALVRRHLHPVAAVARAVEAFHARELAGASCLAVHIRGSDKIIEQAALTRLNELYPAAIDRVLAEQDGRLLLLTDDRDVLSRLAARYGERLVSTDCQRTSGTTGTHYRRDVDRYRLGLEVMVDTYLAAAPTGSSATACATCRPWCVI